MRNLLDAIETEKERANLYWVWGGEEDRRQCLESLLAAGPPEETRNWARRELAVSYVRKGELTEAERRLDELLRELLSAYPAPDANQSLRIDRVRQDLRKLQERRTLESVGEDTRK
ncbi:MAG: hypothetical protein AB1486_21475 [Planctomycetota bacterium]